MASRRPLSLVALAALSLASCLGQNAVLSPPRPGSIRHALFAAAPAFEHAGFLSDALARALPEPSVEPGDSKEEGETEGASFDGDAESSTEPALETVDGVRVDADRALAAIAQETFVYAAPSYRSKKIGYLRGGAIVRRSAEPAGYGACHDGWYRVAPEGYVCVGKRATLDVHHPLVEAASRRPDRLASLPYAYGMSRFPTPPFYTKVPSVREQHRVELELPVRGDIPAPGFEDVTFGTDPRDARGGEPALTWNGTRHSPGSTHTGRALVKSGFAFLSFFESEGRRFGLTVDLDIVPLDRMRRVEPSSFKGIELLGDTTLPVVFTLSRFSKLFRGEPGKSSLAVERDLGYREAVPITGRLVAISGVGYLEVRGGGWIRNENLTRVNPMKNRPGWATPGRTWIDVSILKQTLIAYEGISPVYATLVSTGADGLGDPKDTHSTVRGQFLIHTKHVTATMSGDELGDEFDLRDVPYVQYFREGYALHAAYWHDSFGRPRSHGCINLSPADARWLFQWTDPPVPSAWHGAMSLKNGTLVYVHP